MRTLVATALLAYANADETSLMQDLVKRSESKKLSASADAESSRQESTSKLLDTAVNMIKNGVTPDVITFVDATNQDINEQVLAAIEREHANDQAFIDNLCNDFTIAVEELAASALVIAGHSTYRVQAQQEHHECRADEAFKCAKSRRCEEQLRQKWNTVKTQESEMREIHHSIHDEWCVHPPGSGIFNGPPDIGTWMTLKNEGWLTLGDNEQEGNPFNWAQTSPYPILDLPQDVRDFRVVSKTHFEAYMEKKIVVERAWLEYETKVEECADLEGEWEAKVPLCDEAQTRARGHACQHAADTRAAREKFGDEWKRITREWELAREAKMANQVARKNEWETLKIVQCLLDHVHSSVITSIETGGPCPTIDSDPEGVSLAIEDCHIVTRGCDEDSMTPHLCLTWCTPPDPPALPSVEEPACTPAFVAREQSGFLAEIQSSYEQLLTDNSVYTPASEHFLEALDQDHVFWEHVSAQSQNGQWPFETGLSDAGWAGCAPPLVCLDCPGQEPEEPSTEHTAVCRDPTQLDPEDLEYQTDDDLVDCTCSLHEEYLSPGQSNQDTFKCLDGSCISQAGRCNGVPNCDDGSDETGCDADTTHFVPAYLAKSSTCPEDFHDDVHFRCERDGDCIEKVGLCNGEANCADGTDEAHCSGGLVVTVEATSGRQITVEPARMGARVFHDRAYTFDALHHFQGKTFIKYSNDDKMTDHEHVMTKLRTVEPTTVYIVKLNQDHELPWLDLEGYTPSGFRGVSFSGARSTSHKEWDPDLLTTDNFAASEVYSKIFPAGTISIPGNGGGDGSFLIFMDRPSTEDEFDSRLSAYFESGDSACGEHNPTWNWAWCGRGSVDCALTVRTDVCTSGFAELAYVHGTGEENSYARDGCNYHYYAQYRCGHNDRLGAAEFIGCFVDDGDRDLGDMVGHNNDAATNTFELCRAACGNHIYMGLQFGGECFCSNSYGNGDQYIQRDADECDGENGRWKEPCHSSSYNCGGTWRNAIYQINHHPEHCARTINECREWALTLGLTPGGGGWDFVGEYTTKGCYSYDEGQYAGMAFYGTIAHTHTVADTVTHSERRCSGWWIFETCEWISWDETTHRDIETQREVEDTQDLPPPAGDTQFRIPQAQNPACFSH